MQPPISRTQLNKKIIVLLAITRTLLINSLAFTSLFTLAEALVEEFKECYAAIKNLMNDRIISDESDDDENEHGTGYGTPPSMYYRTEEVVPARRNIMTTAANLAADLAAEQLVFGYQEYLRRRDSAPGNNTVNSPEQHRSAFIGTRVFPT